MKEPKPTMNKCVCFDFDGTIADSTKIFIDIYNTHLAKKYGGRRIEMHSIETLRKLSMLERIRFLNISAFKIPFFIRAARREASGSMDRFPLFDDMEIILQHLKQKGYTIAIISTNKADNIRRFLTLKSISVVDHVYCDIGLSLFVKNRTIQKFLSKTGIKKEHFVYVGDEVRDIEACRKVGVKIIAVTWGFENPEAILKATPDFIAHAPKDIETGVEALLGKQ